MTAQKTPTALGTESIGKLLMQYAVPAIIAMTASSLYNMVDSIFIGHGVGTMALSALALTFPLMNLGAAFGALVGVGAATLISVKLGQKDYDTAQRVLGNVFVLNILLGLAFTVIVFPFLNPILYFFGGSDETVEYARQFMEIILLGNVVTHLYLGLNAVLRASGHPKQAMYATIATVAINTILAPIFIFMFDWGIRGAAIATVSAQVIALLWQLKQFNNANELLHFRWGIFRLKRKIVFDSLAIGMSPFLMNLAACLIVILINQGLKKYGGDLAIGAFGIVNRLVFIVVMIVMGLNQGMQPIAGYNFGAKLYDRVNKVLKLTIIYATCVTTFGFLVGMLAPNLVVGIFTSDAELTELSATGLRITVMFFPIIGFQMVTSNFFQSIGMAGKAIFLSLTRQMLILLPCLLILPHFFGVAGVWYSMPVSDLLASLIALVMLVYQFRKFKTAAAH
ncbi:MATE efflux family protein [Bacteroides uniformis dnLKV2]|uniref:Multidrug export protein MepA n=1 Tax=Bacteroides uniformis dnLKV2 TaxID=1235787 RepID=R9HX18_BACUN|nr:MATE family efflux transporter [Bacteroides uniformis]EOS08494.1 MATE efflux family protein [Bacteroides uniformis dnLKV2]